MLTDATLAGSWGHWREDEFGTIAVFRSRDRLPGDAALNGQTGEPPLPVGLSLRIAARGTAAVAEQLRRWSEREGELNFVFGRSGNAQSITRSGWSTPEEGFLWTLGQRSKLSLPRPTANVAHELQIELVPFVHPGRLPAQRLDLEVNGIRVPSLAIGEQMLLGLQLPWEVLAARESLEVQLDLPDAARPMDVNGVSDARVLGLSLRRLRLTPLARPGLLEMRRNVSPGGQTLAELMMRFESLGENCEFGLLQRRCGAEPLGLLRFASAPLPKLLAALRRRFAGMGTAENVIIELSGNGAEYMVQDRAFGFYHHAWVKAGELTPEQVHAREVRRVPFLVRKMIEDLTSGDKIFVYHGMQRLSLPEARALAAAVRSYGPGLVLWVELASGAHVNGSVAWAGDGLLKGHIDRFAPGEDAHDFATDSWIELCREAANVAAGTRPALIVNG